VRTRYDLLELNELLDVLMDRVQNQCQKRPPSG